MAAVLSGMMSKLTGFLCSVSSQDCPIKDAVLVLGVLYGLSLAFRAFRKTMEGFYVYVLPMFWPEGDWKQKYGQWAVVTGSTQGIGYCHAKEMASRGMDICLIARNRERLGNVAKEIGEIDREMPFLSKD